MGSRVVCFCVLHDMYSWKRAKSFTINPYADGVDLFI